VTDETGKRPVRRRFIAGAVCPSCRAQDRLVVEDGREGPVRRCVSCGYHEVLESDGPQHVPATRVTRRRLPGGAEQESARPVRIVGNGPADDTDH
jgi:uncharacterized metal-binding protein (TIGR02443 family)